MVLPSRAVFRSHKNYLAACLSEIASPVLRLWASHLSGYRVASSPMSWRKGVLLGANHIGDVLYRTCALNQLAQKLPECTWDMVAPPPACEVLDGNPAIRKVHRMELPKSGDTQGFDDLRSEKYDVAICYDTGMYVHPLYLSVRLGIPNRVAYAHKGFSGYVTHPISVSYPQPFAYYFGDLVGDLTETDLRPNRLRPVVYPAPADCAEAENWWVAAGLCMDKPTLAFFLSTRQPTGIWRPERFASLAKKIEAQGLANIVLCGASVDKGSLEALKSQHGLSASVMAGDLNLRALVHFLSKCRAVLCPDSGSRHLANAANTKVFFFRNLRSNAVETGVYCDTEVDLSPKGEFLMPDQQQEILDSIEEDDVFKILSQVFP